MLPVTCCQLYTALRLYIYINKVIQKVHHYTDPHANTAKKTRQRWSLRSQSLVSQSLSTDVSFRPSFAIVRQKEALTVS